MIIKVQLVSNIEGAKSFQKYGELFLIGSARIFPYSQASVKQIFPDNHNFIKDIIQNSWCLMFETLTNKVFSVIYINREEATHVYMDLRECDFVNILSMNRLPLFIVLGNVLYWINDDCKIN